MRPTLSQRTRGTGEVDTARREVDGLEVEADAAGIRSHSPLGADFLLERHAGRDHTLTLGCPLMTVAELHAE
jgi:hypothetical protein